MSKNIVYILVAMLSVGLNANASLDASKLTPEQEKVIARAIQILVDSGAVEGDLSKEVKFVPGLLDRLEAEGLLSTDRSHPSSICTGPFSVSEKN